MSAHGPGSSAPTTHWSGDWVVALPLKELRRAKSRILVPPGLRGELALAMALDTAAAALRCPVVSQVVGICGDPAATRAFEELGCRVVLDVDDQGLNEALASTRALVRSTAPTSGFASLVADLPALGPAGLAAALVEAGRHDRSFVPDASGSGTTLLASLPGAAYVPSYGAASADRHRRSGAVPLSVPASSPLRCDVDTLADLAAEPDGGLGPRTAHLLPAVLGVPGGAGQHERTGAA